MAFSSAELANIANAALDYINKGDAISEPRRQASTQSD